MTELPKAQHTLSWQLVVRPLMWLSNTGQHVAESRETGNFWQQVASPHQSTGNKVAQWVFNNHYYYYTT